MPDRHTVYFSDMALDLHIERDPALVVQRIAEHAKSALACDDAGIMLVKRQQRMELGATTSQRLLDGDRNQIRLNEGPCLEGAEPSDYHLIEDTLTDSRWPSWARGIAASGLRSVLTVRLETPNRGYGTLALYAARPDRFDHDDVAVAKIFAQHASIALAEANNDFDLKQALDARKLIGQAQGVLMERYDLDGGRAFDVLRRFSQDSNIKLREVAQMIVDKRTVPVLARFGTRQDTDSSGESIETGAGDHDPDPDGGPDPMLEVS